MRCRKNRLPDGGGRIFLGVMIRGGFLTAEERRDLTELARDGLAEHRLARRANALVLLDRGMSCDEVGRVLLIDDDTIRTWHRRFQEAGVKSLKDFDYKGSASSLTPAQQDALKAWVTEALPRTTHEIGAWIEWEFGVVYESRGGLAALLNRLGLAYRKTSRASSIRRVSGRSSTLTRPFSGPWATTRPRCSSTPSIPRTAGRLLGGQGRQGRHRSGQRPGPPQHSWRDRPGDGRHLHARRVDDQRRDPDRTSGDDRVPLSGQAGDPCVSRQRRLSSRQGGDGVAGAAHLSDQASLHTTLLSAP